MPKPSTESRALAAGGVAAILASACCLGPLLLVMLGVGGAWVANLQALDPLRPVFIAVALVALFFAWRRLYRRTADCAPGEVCAMPAAQRGYRTFFWIVAALVLVALTFPYAAPLFY